MLKKAASFAESGEHELDRGAPAQVVPGTEDVYVEMARVEGFSGFGFGLGTNDRGQFLIVHVHDEGPAYGKLEVADELIQLNNAPVTTIEYTKLVECISFAQSVSFMVRRAIRGAPQKRGTISVVSPQTKVVERQDNLGSQASGAGPHAAPTQPM